MEKFSKLCIKTIHAHINSCVHANFGAENQWSIQWSGILDKTGQLSVFPTPLGGDARAVKSKILQG